MSIKTIADSQDVMFEVNQLFARGYLETNHELMGNRINVSVTLGLHGRDDDARFAIESARILADAIKQHEDSILNTADKIATEEFASQLPSEVESLRYLLQMAEEAANGKSA